MKFSKRILSLALSALMLMSMFTMVIGISASADETNDAEIASIQNSLLETISTDTWSSRWNDTSHIDATGFKGNNEMYTFAQYKGFVDIADIDWTLQFTYNQPKATNINSYLSIGDMTLKFSYTVSGDVRGEIKYTMTSGSDSSYKPLNSTRVYATGDSGDFLTADVFNASTIKIERVGDTLKFYRNGEIMVFENGVSEFDATKFNFNANANSKQIYIYSWAPATSGYWVKDITLVQSFPYKTVDALNAYLAGVAYVDNTSVESVKEAVAIRDMVDAAVEAGTVSSTTYGMIDFSALETAVAAMENDKVTQFDVIAGEGGTVDAVAEQDFYVGDTYTIKAAANTGYVFKEWQNADGEQIATSAEYTVTLAKTNTFTAVFAEDWDTDYSIVSCDDSLGTVAGDGFTIGDELRVGNSYTVVATPAEACVFTEWTVDGNAVAETASYTFTYVKGIQIVANFRMVELTAVTVNTEGVGTVTIQGTSYRDKYAVGDEVTLVASFNYKDGYIFDHWEKDGQSIGTETSLVQTVVEGLTVKAVFTNDIGKLADYEIAHFEYPLLNAISKTEWNDRSGSSSNIVDGVGLKGTGGGAGWYMYTGSINLSTADFTYTFTYNCPNINNTDLHSANIGSLSFKFNTNDNKFYISGGSSSYNPLSSSGSYIYASGNSGSYVTKAEFYTSNITIVRTGDTFRFYRNDELMVFANGMSEFDATKFDFNANANSSQLRFQLWCPNTNDIVVKDISLVKLLGYSTMDEFNASLASVDSADSAAIAESHEVVDYLKNNTLYVKEKIDTSKLVHDYANGYCVCCGEKDPNATFYNVTVKGRNGSTVTSEVVSGTEIVLADIAPFAYAYEVTGWKDGDDNVIDTDTITVTADITLVPIFEVAEAYTGFTVTVEGAANTTGGTYQYNDRVVIVFDEDQLSEGQYFGGWINSGTGAVISYATTYKFYVGSDVSISASITDAETTATPVIAMTDVCDMNGDGSRWSFLSERTVPDGYTYVGSGFIYNTTEITDFTSADNRVKASQSVAKNGQYRLTVNLSSATDVYIIAYLTYTDAEGAEHTVYSGNSTAVHCQKTVE